MATQPNCTVKIKTVGANLQQLQDFAGGVAVSEVQGSVAAAQRARWARVKAQAKKK